jgi:hypothetical protein
MNESRAGMLVAILDEIDDMDTDDPRFEGAVTKSCFCQLSLSQSEIAEAEQLRHEALDKRSTEDLERIFAQLKDEDRSARIYQIGFRLGFTISNGLFGRRR